MACPGQWTGLATGRDSDGKASGATVQCHFPIVSLAETEVASWAQNGDQNRRLPFWVVTKAHKSEMRTRLSRARRPMSITARHPADLAIAQAARGWPCPSLLHRRRTRTPHARAIIHLVQVSRRWRQARVGLCALHSLFARPSAYARLIRALSTCH